MPPQSTTELTVYGAYWCSDTRLIRDYLEEGVIAYTYVELEAADWVRAQNDGTERKPTLRFEHPPLPDAVLAVPTTAELRKWLAKHQIS
jgi:hypothetical protein